MTDDLIPWLREQLDEDERVAREAHQANWRWYVEDKGVVTKQDDAGDYEQWSATYTRSDAEHIAHHDPARVLAEVDAKRRILDWLDKVEGFMDRDDMSWHRLGGAVDVDHARRLLALPYADREGFREEWAGEGQYPRAEETA